MREQPTNRGSCPRRVFVADDEGVATNDEDVLRVLRCLVLVLQGLNEHAFIFNLPQIPVLKRDHRTNLLYYILL